MNKLEKITFKNAKMLLKCHVGAIIVLQFANFTETGFKRIEFKSMVLVKLRYKTKLVL